MRGKASIRKFSLHLIEHTFNMSPTWLREDLSDTDALIIAAIEKMSPEDKADILKYIEKRSKA